MWQDVDPNLGPLSLSLSLSRVSLGYLAGRCVVVLLHTALFYYCLINIIMHIALYYYYCLVCSLLYNEVAYCIVLLLLFGLLFVV